MGPATPSKTDAKGSIITPAEAPIKSPVWINIRNYIDNRIDEVINHNFLTINSHS